LAAANTAGVWIPADFLVAALQWVS
jgi:hypothetical protein